VPRDPGWVGLQNPAKASVSTPKLEVQGVTPHSNRGSLSSDLRSPTIRKSLYGQRAADIGSEPLPGFPQTDQVSGVAGDGNESFRCGGSGDKE
jgi:hypothetical protein